MTEVEQIAEAAEERVVFVDNAIWLVCARSELYLANSKLAEMVGEDKSPADQADGLAALFQSWKTEDDAGEQRETPEQVRRVAEGNEPVDFALADRASALHPPRVFDRPRAFCEPPRGPNAACATLS